MTDTNQLPEPELGYIKTDKSNQPAFSARQMREMIDTNQLPTHTITIRDHPEPRIMQWSDLELAAIKKYAEQYALQARAQVQGELEPYDAGLLNDFGGGNVEWWQDYIRAELGHAHDFYQSQIATPQPVQATQAEVTDGIRPEDFTVDVVVKPMGGFAQINTKGVRVTHKPTGISSTCDVARSQHANRNQAFEKLRAILSQQPDNTACKSVQKRLEAQQPATSEPDEWKLVPIVPTEKMLLAYTGGAVTNAGFRWCRHQWSAMLAAAPAARPAPSVLKDDQIATLVNKVRDIARMFHDHQSLRERIAIELVPALKASQEVKSNAERYRWLRDHDHWPAPFSSSQEPEPVRGRDLDSNIDAAMLAAKP